MVNNVPLHLFSKVKKLSVKVERCHLHSLAMSFLVLSLANVIFNLKCAKSFCEILAFLRWG